MFAPPDILPIRQFKSSHLFLYFTTNPHLEKADTFIASGKWGRFLLATWIKILFDRITGFAGCFGVSDFGVWEKDLKEFFWSWLWGLFSLTGLTGFFGMLWGSALGSFKYF